MIFVEHALTPKSTLKTNPLITSIHIVLGTITLVSVQFPPGVNALAHCKITWGLYQLFPSNEQGDFATGGETVTWDEQIEINTEPLELKMVTWNEDDTYDHTITARIVMQPSQQQQTVQQVLAALVPSQVQGQQG
jgi:hypothetical protein